MQNIYYLFCHLCNLSWVKADLKTLHVECYCKEKHLIWRNEMHGESENNFKHSPACCAIIKNQLYPLFSYNAYKIKKPTLSFAFLTILTKSIRTKYHSSIVKCSALEVDKVAVGSFKDSGKSSYFLVHTTFIYNKGKIRSSMLGNLVFKVKYKHMI